MKNKIIAKESRLVLEQSTSQGWFTFQSSKVKEKFSFPP